MHVWPWIVYSIILHKVWTICKSFHNGKIYENISIEEGTLYYIKDEYEKNTVVIIGDTGAFNFN